ncbi:unnamed protein product [Sphagnum balticum]
MAFERNWAAVPPQPFTANGTTTGLVTLASTAGFRVKQCAYLKNSAGFTLAVQIKIVLSCTQLIVGTINNAQIANWPKLDISSWTVASGAVIGAEWQGKNNISSEDIPRTVYESDPVVAIRTVQVDECGDIYSKDNPMPISFDGTVQIGDVSIVEGGNTMKVNADGSINVIVESQPSPNEKVVSTYNEITNIPSGSTTQIVSYTVPPSTQGVLQRCPVSGENVARYDLLINGVIVDTLRTMFGADLTQMFDFTSGNDSGYVLNAGDVVSIQVLHNRPYVASFEARIQVLQINL